MVIVSTTCLWDLEVDRGPDWLFVRPRPTAAGACAVATLGEQIWMLLEQNFTYRLVLELDEVAAVDSRLVEQLLWLEGQIAAHDGTLRLCGISNASRESTAGLELDGRFTLFRDREDAVMGQLRHAPRPLPR